MPPLHLMVSTITIDKHYSDYKYLKFKSIFANRFKPQKNYQFQSFSLQNNAGDITAEIQKYKPNILIFICYNWNIDKILSVSSKLKEKLPKINITLTGPYVRPIARKIINNNPQISYVIKKIETRALQKFYKTIQQTYPQSAENKIFPRSTQTTGRPVETTSPYTAKNKTDFQDKIVPLKIQTGCNKNCIFCSPFPEEAPDKNKFELKSLKTLEKEIKFLLEQNTKKISISPSILNANINFAKNICELFIKYNKNNIPIWANLSPESTDEQLASLLRKANFKLAIDLPTTTNEVLESINRNFNKEKFKQGYKALQKFNIPKSWTLILGLPGESTTSFTNVLKEVFNQQPELLKIFPLLVSPGTKLWDKNSFPDIKFSSSPPHRILQTPELTEKEFKGTFKLSMASIFVYNRIENFSNPQEIISLGQKWVDRSELWNNLNYKELGPFYTPGELKLEQNFKDTFPGLQQNMSGPVYIN